MKFYDLYLHGITVFMGFFAMLNPIGNLPVFLGMVKEFDIKTQNKVALRATLAAFIIISIFTIFGHIIFRMFGITLPAFQIAGGIIVFIIGFQMLNARENPIHAQSEEEKAQMETIAHDMAISPLGIPLLAGPGTISTAMNFVGVEKSISNVLLVIGIFGIMCLITYFLFISSRVIATKISTSMLKVVSRIMGLILAVIAVQMLINGIEGTIDLFNQHQP
ncbi:MAG: MarC family protein [Bacteroidales bacterium]|jgi:multiple antibiotic resistance protein|nr:MarC family protein [Bacteroidales bacterium]